MNRFPNIFYRKVYFFRNYLVFLLFICVLFYIYPRKVKSRDVYNSWKVDIDLSLQRWIENYPLKIGGLSRLINHQTYFTKRYHFLHLPKRVSHASFSEMTSANPDTANPLSPDFSFHLSYGKREAKIFEHYGCGCIYRIYLLPPFSSFQDRIDHLTSDDMNNLKVIIELDEVSMTYSVKEIMDGNSYPFLHPLTSRNNKPISGIGAFTQLCYDKSAVVYYIDDNDYPSNVFNMTVDCVSNELKCPIKQYSSISYLKVPLSLQSPAKIINKENVASLKTLAELFMDPVSNGPNAEVGCNLLCAPLKQNEVLTFYDVKGHSAIITSMLLTILDYHGNAEDWNGIFLQANFDDVSPPQVNISIESLFISQSLANDFRGAAYGRIDRRCYYGLENNSRQSGLLKVGYLYLPMPFWKTAKIRLLYLGTSNKLQWQPKLACYQLTEANNFYNPELTGYLHISQVFHSGQTDKRREVVQVVKGWGHLVGLGVEVHNLKPDLNGALIQRWAALQADPLIFIDNLKTPIVRGTGLEDYFSYAHGFAGASNTTYSFVGVPLALTAPKYGNTWICYRQHLLDPIPFDESLEFIMEGTDKILYTSKAENISFESFSERLLAGQTVFTYLALFYHRTRHSALNNKLCDKITMCDVYSRIKHDFSSSHVGTPFSVKAAYFVGDVRSDQPSDITCGMSFPDLAVIRFVLSLPDSSGTKFVFKRTFHMQPFQWNDLCSVRVNGEDLGLWLFPMGSTTATYSLREEAREIWISDRNANQNGGGSRHFNFNITVMSLWRDVSYELCSVH